MAADPLKEQLEAWGRATATRFAVNEDGPSQGDNVLANPMLARQRELGMRSRLKREKEREIVGRSGEDRRRFMAKKMAEGDGVDGKPTRLRLGLVPMWAVDPIPSRNDADRPRDLPQARVDIGIPDELTWVERAYIQLRRQHPLRALCFHEEFCTPGSQDAKAARVQKAYGGRLSKWQYRLELQRAIDWVQGSRAA
jgi:hypothetical protein